MACAIGDRCCRDRGRNGCRVCAGPGRSSSTAARSISLIVGAAAGGGYDAYARRSAATSERTFPAIRPWWCRTCRAPAATRPPAISIRVQRPRTAPRSARSFPARSWRRSSPTRRDPARSRPSSPISAAPTATSIICVVRADAPIKTFEDAFTQEIIVGASNEGGTTRDMPTLLEQRAWREIPRRHRLCRQQRDHARGRAPRDPRLCGFGYTEPAHQRGRTGSRTSSSGSSCRRTPRATPH